VYDAFNQEIGTLSGPSLMLLTIGGVRFQAAVGPGGFGLPSLQVYYAALNCAGPPYSTANMSSDLFYRQLAPVGSIGYFVSGTPIAPPPPVLPPGPSVLQGYSFQTRIGAGLGSCTNGTSVFGSGVQFYPMSTVDLSGFVAPFHIG
jgi:hypothetical protein